MKPPAMMSILLSLLLPISAQAITVKGKVVDEKTKAPVPGIVIQAEHHENRNAEQPDNFVQRATSGPDGTFSMELTRDERQFMILIADDKGHIYTGYAHVREDVDLGTIPLKRQCVLTGLVKDKDHKPVADVEVTAELRLREYTCHHHVPAAKTRTAKDGSFEFPDLSPVEYQCSISSPAYQPSEYSILISDDLNYLELQLEPGFTIEGRILGPSGQPLKNIRVTTGRRGASAVSDTEGRYRIPGLGKGQVELSIQSPDYALPQGTPVEVKCETVKTVAPDLKLLSAGRLSLRLITPEQGPEIPAALDIHLSGKQAQRRHRSQSLSAGLTNGVACFAGIPPGSYRVQIASENLPKCSADAEIKPGEETRVELTLPRVGTLIAEISDEKAQPIKAAMVSLRKAEPEEKEAKRKFDFLSTVSDHRYESSGADGKVTFKNLPEGSYEITVQAKDRPQIQETVTVKPGATTLKKFQIGKGLSITGTVTESDGSPAASIRVIASGPLDRPNRASESKDTTVKEDGTFEISGLTTGKYGLAVLLEKTHEPLVNLPSVPAGCEEVMVTLGKKHLIQGIVVTASGLPVSNAVVQASQGEEPPSFDWRRSQDDEPSVLKTDRTGRFTIDLREGQKYQISAFARLLLPSSAALDLTAGKAPPRDPIRIVLEEGCQIRGTVVSQKDGKPVKGMNVMVSGQTGMPSMPAPSADADEASPGLKPTDEQGRFLVEGAPSGIVTLTVTPADEKSRYQQPVASKQVQVKKGEPADVRIEIAETGQIKGKTVSTNDQPLAGCYVTLMTPKGPRGQFSGQSEEDGSFTFENVPPGEYSVLWFDMSSMREDAEAAVRSTPKPQTAKVTVEANKTAELVLKPTSPGATSSSAIPGTIARKGAAAGAGQITFSALSVMTEELDPMTMFAATRQAEVNDRGQFTVQCLSTGKYVFAFQPRPKKDSTAGDEEPFAFQAFSGSVELAAGQTNLALNLTGTTVRGAVSDKDGKPVAQCRVLIVPSSGSRMEKACLSRWALTDKEGKFKAECVTPGTYDLRAVHETQGVVSKRNLKVQGDSITVDLSIPPGLKLSGKISNSTGASSRGAMLIAVSAAENEPIGYETVKADGTYSFDPPLPADEYKVFVIMDGYAVESGVVKLDNDSQFNAELVPGGDIKVVVTAPSPEKRKGLVVTVTDAQNRQILRVPKMGLLDEWGAMAPHSCVLPATDAAGTTVVKGLRPGKYSVAIEGSNKKAAVEVKPLDTVSAQISL